MTVHGHDLKSGATRVRHLLAIGLAQPVSSITSNAAIIALHWLQACSAAPVGKLVAERGCGREGPPVVRRQERHGIALWHGIKRGL
jgi:hypothetical protein